MDSGFEREVLLIGQEKVNRLANAKVLLFGVGGVGGYTAECLARAGIGHITLVDSDKVDITNINRQILALHSTVGKYKVDVCRERILDINPDCEVITKQLFYLPETAGEFNFYEYDYIADCIDTVAAKIDIICRAKECGTPVISAMGAGGKLDPSAFKAADISKTEYCPLAKVMRRELRKKGINHLKVVYSPEYAFFFPDLSHFAPAFRMVSRTVSPRKRSRLSPAGISILSAQSSIRPTRR